MRDAGKKLLSELDRQRAERNIDEHYGVACGIGDAMLEVKKALPPIEAEAGAAAVEAYRQERMKELDGDVQTLAAKEFLHYLQKWWADYDEPNANLPDDLAERLRRVEKEAFGNYMLEFTDALQKVGASDPKDAEAEAQAALIPIDAERPPIDSMTNYLDCGIGAEPNWDINMKADELRQYIAYIRRLEALLARLDALEGRWEAQKNDWIENGTPQSAEGLEVIEACLSELRAAREVKP